MSRGGRRVGAGRPSTLRGKGVGSICVRVTLETKRMLSDLCKSRRMNKSELLRILIKKEHDMVGFE